MGRIADAYARISPRLAHGPGSSFFSRTHAAIYRRTRGRVGRRFMGGDVLVLRTVGRRSGEPREAPMFYLPFRDGWAVVASNAASRRPPAWWLNLEASPEAEALVPRRSWTPVRARRASGEERDELWPRFVAMYRGYDHYAELAKREMPVVVLEPRA